MSDAQTLEILKQAILKERYKWLSSWERQHLNLLVDIDKALVEKKLVR